MALVRPLTPYRTQLPACPLARWAQDRLSWRALGRTLGSASPLTARLAGENARLRPSPHCPPGDTHSPVVSSLHCPFQTVGCLWEGPSTALSVAEQDPLPGNRLRIMTTAMAALLRAALPAICYSVAPEPSPRPLTSQSQA